MPHSTIGSMRPVLFELGPLAVNGWGVAAGIAFVVAWGVLRAELERLEGRGEAAAGIVIAAAIGGLLGAKLYWLAEHPDGGGLPMALSGSGFTWYGGVLGGAMLTVVVARRSQVSMPSLLGAAAPALAVGYALGRVACQLAGDGTYGVASDLPWAMSYPNGEVPTTEQVHPTPVYETLASLVIFAVLWRWRRRTSPVTLFAIYLGLAGVERLLVEFVRRNDEVVAGMTQPQLWSVAMILGGAALLAASRRPNSVAPRLA